MSVQDKIMFDFSPPEHSPLLSDGELINFRIKPRKAVCEWAEENISLIKPSYLYPGRFRAWAFQREPINAFNYWSRIIYIGAVQTFKSGITDLQAFYAQSVLGLNGMIAYANEKKVADAFDLRYVPMIKSKENKILNDLWDGKDDSLTKNQLKLSSCTWKIASANNKDDIASFSAPITIGSEVGKWKIKEGQFNPIILLRGRSDAAFAMGDVKKSVLESSPFEEGDLLFQEVFREGTIVLKPFYQCPHCGGWQLLTDYQIKLRDKKLKGLVSKIRELKEESVFYECIHCKKEITEAERGAISENVVWAAHEMDEEHFKQKGEIIDKDGNIKGRLDGGVRLGYDTVSYWWSRLEDVAFPFYECLARFFDSLHDDEKKKSYENETMARWWKKKTGRVEEKYLHTRKIEYYQWGEKHFIPDNVLIITLGVDTQDDGFYYSFVGWGQWLSWLILRQSFIPCPRVDKGYEYQVFDKFINNLHIEPLRWSDGTFADITIGGIDRGGHRPEDVDFIVKHFPGGRLISYVGLTQKYEDRPMIYKSDKGNFYLGQSDPISEDVGALISSESFYLPMDIDHEFIKQIGRQFHHKKISPNGTVKIEWVHNYQGPDHYRDTLNINLAAAKVKKIDSMLLNQLYCESLKKNRAKVCPVQIKATEQPKQQQQNNSRKSGGYFANLGGRVR
jgi:phage terminase large subunit GpA-like protein